MSVGSSALTYELRLGVTGHRDLHDEPAIAGAIGRLLDRIDNTLHGQAIAPLSWTVVSALARGADRLFADAVLMQKNGRLEVVTPFPITEYVHDFDTGRDREMFDRLLSGASRVDQLLGDRGLGREAPAYLRAGEHVVDTSEIVIAIWDGRPSGGGGTGDVVEYAVRRERIVVWLDSDIPDAAPRIIHSVSYGKDGRLSENSHREFPQSARELSLGYHQQTRYCLDPAVSQSSCAALFSDRREVMVEAGRAAGFDPDILLPVLGEGLRQFVRADALAQYYQRRYNWQVGGVLYLAATAVTVAVGQVLFFPRSPQVILGEIVAMVVVLVLWWWGRRHAWHEKWLHDRYLAERLRAATFIPLVGAQPRQPPPHGPLPFYRGPRHWLARAVEELTRSTPPQIIPFEPLKQFIVSQWLEDQRDHHARGAAKKARALHWRHRLGLGLFWLTLVMAILHFAGVGHPDDAAAAGPLRVDLWISFFALVLPAWAGAVHAATSQLELERLAQRSAQMVRVLDEAVYRAKSASSIDELRDVCRDVGALMADENHEWWVLLSFQRPQLHV